MLLPSDIINIISNHLSPIDNYHLYCSCQFFHHYIDIKTSIIKNINHRLSLILGDKLEEFKQYIKSGQYAISGSFLLQCMLDEYWERSDVDVYTMAFDRNYLDIEIFLREQFQEWDGNFDDGYHAQEVEWIRNYHYYFEHIQIIAVNMYSDNQIYESIFELPSNVSLFKRFIDDMADFAILKNIYYYDGTDHLILNNLYNIFNRITEYHRTGGIKVSIERYHKYKERGFRFSNLDTLSYKDFDCSYFVRVGLNENYFNDEEEVIKFFGTNDFSDLTRYRCIEKESECVHTNFPPKHPNDDICYTKSCLVKFLNPNLRHRHLKSLYKRELREDDTILIL